MSQDPVVEEVRARGRSLTARYGNDVSALLRVLRERARAEPRGVVDTVKVVAGDRSRDAEREPRL
jgi:hypothetical protein